MITSLLQSVLGICFITSHLWAGYSTASEVFSALTDVTQAINASQILAKELNNYVEREEERLNRMRHLVSRLELATKVYAPGTEDIRTIEATANPVSIFLAILQLASDWPNQISSIFGQPAEDTPSKPVSSAFEEFDSRRDMFLRLKWYADMLPGTSDINGASDAIIRLQGTYEIPAETIADGHIDPFSGSPKLTDNQCFHLGKYAYDIEEYKHAEEWFRVILKRLDIGTNIPGNPDVDGLSTFTREHALDYLAYSLGRQGRYKEALEVTKDLLIENPMNTIAEKNLLFYETELNKLQGVPELDEVRADKTPKDSESSRYEYLCRNENLTYADDPSLICHYVVAHPYFVLSPIKEEVKQLNPKIVLFHEFVTPQQVDHILNISRPRLRRATVRNPVSGRLETASYRITKNVWIPGDTDETIKWINNKIALVTGLNMEFSEDLQVANYGIGGHYAPHFDHARKRERDSYEMFYGNRIATFMVYLTNVQAGGSTVFTQTGARVRPVERAAVFWYNLLPSGDGDILSRHAACPVLIGNKWVMNKWIRERGQEFHRPCDLQRNLPNSENDDI